jgi:hypothetical protein
MTTTPSLPGLTRQSILFEKCFSRSAMGARVKPAYDDFLFPLRGGTTGEALPIPQFLFQLPPINIAKQ